MKKQILVPVDLSDLSRIGVETAIHISKKIDAEVNLLHIIEEEKPEGISVTADTELNHKAQSERERFIVQLIKKRQADLENYLRTIDLKGLTVKTLMEVGDFTDCMTIATKENDIDMIVMGTTGEESVSEFFSGNHAEQTSRETGIPVLSVKSSDNFKEHGSIGFIINLNKPNEELVKMVRNLTNLTKLDLVIFHSKDDDDPSNKVLLSDLEQICGKYGLSPKRIIIMDTNEDFIDEVQAAISDFNVKIIAKSVKKQSGLSRLFLEDVTEELINDFSEASLIITR
ncbi:MAG: universal stress protein [Cyclobacteriaceae bacterium]